MRKLVIFGTGVIAEAISYYFTRDSKYRIVGYGCDKAYIREDTFLGKPVIATDKISTIYPPSDHSIFVAVGYQAMNSMRSEKVDYFTRQGYELANYVSSTVKGNFTIGKNSILMDDVVIQPYVTIGNNTLIWGGAMIGHHASIGDNCWLTGSCAIGGLVKMGKNCFVGLNATLGNEITIGEGSMIGAHTSCTRNLPSKTVLVCAQTEPHRLNSDQFTKMSSCFRV